MPPVPAEEPAGFGENAKGRHERSRWIAGNRLTLPCRRYCALIHQREGSNVQFSSAARCGMEPTKAKPRDGRCFLFLIVKEYPATVMVAVRSAPALETT